MPRFKGKPIFLRLKNAAGFRQRELRMVIVVIFENWGIIDNCIDILIHEGGYGFVHVGKGPNVPSHNSRIVFARIAFQYADSSMGKVGYAIDLVV